MLAPRPSLIDKHITTNPSTHMKKSLLLIILFLLYQVLAAVMAQVWTHLNGSGAGAEAADVAAMPSATSSEKKPAWA
jgi:flagellar basal body-associated protein FliL